MPVEVFRCIFCISVVLAGVNFVQAQIPAFVWNNKGNAGGSHVNEGMSETEFSKLLHERLGSTGSSKKVVLFLMDELSMEDLHLSSDSFQQLQSLLSRGWSHSVSSVSHAARSAQRLLRELGEPSLLQEGASVPLDQRALLVKLQHADLATADAKIGQVMRQLSAEDVLAVFTASQPSYQLPAVDNYLHFSGRRLLEVKPVDSNFINYTSNGESIFMTYINMSIVVTREKNTTVTQPTGVTLSNMTQTGGSNDSVTLNWKDVGSGISDVTLTFTFNTLRKLRRWVVQNVTLSAMVNGSKIEALALRGEALSAPLGRSYHCSPKQGLIPLNPGSDVTEAIIYVDEVQLQPFAKKDRWGTADDCVGFFTIGIWTGLVPVIIFTIILVYGFLMIIDIKINDRFDDPRGKTIQVNVAE